MLLLLWTRLLSWSMRILFDHGTPAPFIPFLEGHTVTKAKDVGWERLSNIASLQNLTRRQLRL